MKENNRLPVLDSGYLQLIESWGSDMRIVESARMSTQKGFQGWEKDASLLEYLYKNKHMSPFEMAGATFEIKAPILVFRQWHRHRTQSYNEMSGRYTVLPDENFFPTMERVEQSLTPTTNKQAQGVTQHKATIAEIRQWFEMVDAAYNAAEAAIQFGLSIGISKELSRIPTPIARYSVMRASGNLRNWLHFLELRQDYHAEEEIRLYANAAFAELHRMFPRTLELYLKYGGD